MTTWLYICPPANCVTLLFPVRPTKLNSSPYNRRTPKLAVSTMVCAGLVSWSPATANRQTTSSTLAEEIWNSLCVRGKVHSRKRVSSFSRVTQAILRRISSFFDNYASHRPPNASKTDNEKTRQRKINNNIPFELSMNRACVTYASAISSAVQFLNVSWVNKLSSKSWNFKISNSTCVSRVTF